MPGLVPGIHAFRAAAKTWMAPELGLSEFGIIGWRKSGKPDFALTSPAMTERDA
jgi:hypothetical protein